MFEGLLQPTHLILILAIVLVIFGPGKLSEVGKTLGTTVRELQAALHPAPADPNLAQATDQEPPAR